MFFSKITGGFYDPRIHGENIPVDAVEITDEQHESLLTGQSSGKIIGADAAGNPFLSDPPLANFDQVWQQIKAKRAAVLLGGVLVSGKWFYNDDQSRIKYLGLLKIAEQTLAGGGNSGTVLQYAGADIVWKTMDNTPKTITVQIAQDVFAAVSGLEFTTHAVAEAHKAAMEAAAVPSAYDFSTGWPQGFSN